MAVQPTPPTVEQEIAALKSFTTVDGATQIDPTNKPTVEDGDDEQDAEVDGAEGEVADAAAGEDGQPKPKPAGEDGKPKLSRLSAKDRVQQAVTRQRVAERLLAAERQTNAETLGALRARLDAVERGLTPAADKSKDAANQEPQPKDFPLGELDPGYLRAVARHAAEQAARQATDASKQELSTAQQQQAEQAAQAEFIAKRDALYEVGLEKYPDFEELVVHNDVRTGGWPLSPFLGGMIADSDFGADMVYHLATHPDEARKIYGRPAREQAAFFGRLEAKFSAESAAKPKPGAGKNQQQKPAGQGKTTQVPAPLANQARGGGSATPVSGDTADFAAFEAAANGAK